MKQIIVYLVDVVKHNQKLIRAVLVFGASCISIEHKLNQFFCINQTK